MAAASASSCGMSSAFMAVLSWLSAGGEPARLALLQEGLHALAAFVARTDVGDALDRLRDERVVDLAAGHVSDQLLAGAHGGGAGAGERLDEFVDLGVERVGRD